MSISNPHACVHTKRLAVTSPTVDQMLAFSFVILHTTASSHSYPTQAGFKYVKGGNEQNKSFFLDMQFKKVNK